jgi:ribonuclease-3
MISDDAARCLGYTFENEGIIAEALTHASSAGHRLESNERLEFLGDAILGCVVCEHIFNCYPDLLEGDLTKIKSAVVSRKVCAEVSQKLNLGALLNLGKGMTSRPSLPSSIEAAVLESVIAAVYLDGGMEPARAFIIENFRPFIDEAAQSAHQRNYKSVLQHYAQKQMPVAPTYVLLDEKGPDHSKCFEVCVEVGGRRFSPAWANSKKEAEQQAALNALRELDLVECEEEHIIFNESVMPRPAPRRRAAGD